MRRNKDRDCYGNFYMDNKTPRLKYQFDWKEFFAIIFIQFYPFWLFIGIPGILQYFFGR